VGSEESNRQRLELVAERELELALAALGNHFTERAAAGLVSTT